MAPSTSSTWAPCRSSWRRPSRRGHSSPALPALLPLSLFLFCGVMLCLDGEPVLITHHLKAMEVKESVQPVLPKLRALRRIEKMRRAEQKEGSDKQRLEEDLEEARERLDAERAAQRLAAERVEATTREVELLRADLAATKQNLDKAEGDKTRVRPPAAA